MAADIRIDDPIIRDELCKRLGRKDGGKIVAEWNIGACRIDLAVITASYLHGIEIKSGCDTLNRLSLQAHEYGKVFDVCTLVAVREHVEKAAVIIPAWWGITEVVPSGKVVDMKPRPFGALIRRTIERRPGVMLIERRPPGINPEIDVGRLSWLLWCRELRTILADHNLITLRREAKWRMISIASRNFSVAQFRPLVIAALLARTDWRRDVAAEEGAKSVG